MRYSMSYYLLIGANLLKYSVFMPQNKKYKQIFIRNKCIKIHNVKFVRFVHFVKFKFNTVIVAIF